MIPLPSDLPSYLWGLLTGLVGLFFVSFINAAGSDAWSWFKGQLSSTPAEPERVSKDFTPEDIGLGRCCWANEEKCLKLINEGWTYYLKPKTGSRCYRVARNGHREQYREYLVLDPSADLTL